MKTEAASLKEEPAGIAVDMLRGGLAILVLLAHGLESAVAMTGQSLPPLLAVTLGHGGFWVGGFFVLSGFCVHRAIMALKQRGGGFAGPYLLARFTRLYPVYLIALMLTIFVQMTLGEFSAGQRLMDAGMAAPHLFMLQGITGTLHEMKPAWSLTYEVVYYLVWPILLGVCGWNLRRTFVVAGAGAIMVAAVLFASWKMTGAGDSVLMPLAMIAAQFLLWLGGAWLAQEWELVKRRAASWPGALSLLGVIFVYAVQAFLIHRNAPQWTHIIAGYAALPCWLGVIAGANAWKGLANWKPAAVWFGLLSYPLYILHQVLLDAVVLGARAYHLEFSFGESVVLLLAWVMAWMITFGVPMETRTLRWRADWLRRHKPGRLSLIKV